MIESSRELAVERQEAVTSAELSRVIRRIVRLFEVGELGNYRTSDAMSQLADYLHTLGSTPVSHLHRTKVDREPLRRTAYSTEYEKISLDKIEEILAGQDASKNLLVRLARSRFGVPESRLRRLSIAGVLDALRAAVAHERSLEVIEQNAEASGKARQS